MIKDEYILYDLHIQLVDDLDTDCNASLKFKYYLSKVLNFKDIKKTFLISEHQNCFMYFVDHTAIFDHM